MSNSRRLHDLTRPPPHLVCRDEVAAAGLPIETINAEMRAGRIEKLQPGIYAPVAVSSDLSVRTWAALRAAGPGAALSHRTAARLHDLLIAKSDAIIEILVRPDSALEVMFARLIHRAGLPMPEFQYQVSDGHGVVARVDACWADRRLIAEVDGLRAHATAAALDRDLARQNRLVALGYIPLRFTWSHIVRNPDGVAAQLAGFLRRERR